MSQNHDCSSVTHGYLQGNVPKTGFTGKAISVGRMVHQITIYPMTEKQDGECVPRTSWKCPYHPPKLDLVQGFWFFHTYMLNVMYHIL